MEGEICKKGKTRSLTIYNRMTGSRGNGPNCSDAVSLSDSVLKRINDFATGQKTDENAENKEEEVYWNNRISCLAESHDKIDQNYSDVMKNAKKDYARSYAPLMDTALCKIMTDKITSCYKENPDKPLECAKLAETYTSCVNSAGMEAINNLND